MAAVPPATPPRTASIRSAALLATLAAALAAAVFALFWARGATPPPPRDWTALWHSDPPVVSTTPGGLLETSTVRMTEDFYRSDSRTWWGIYLGETVAQIEVPVTYRYGVPLADPDWHVVTRGDTTVVVAPPLRPSLPVAIDTGAVRERTENGWARFDAQLQLDALRGGISADLESRAHDPARLALVREASRRTIAEFVERWLVARDAWWPDVFSSVKVLFADEVDAHTRAQLSVGT